MGSHVSKSNTPGTSSSINLNANNMATELSSSEAACKLDSDLQSFDATFQTRMSQVINTMLSFNSHSQVTECLLDMNQDVVNVILAFKKDIWNEKEFLELVEEYFNNSLKTLDFCNALKKCLQRAKDSQLPLREALEHFDEDTEKVGNSRYARTLQGLKKFKAAVDPFTEEFIQIYQSVYKQQKLMYDKLKLRVNKLNKKLKCIRTLRLFVAAAAAVLICSVLAAAVSSPHAATTLAAAAAAPAIPIGLMRKWIDLLKECENALKGQRGVTISALAGTFAAKTELGNIRVHIDGLKHEIESLMKNADSAIEQEAVKVAIEEIKKKLADFTEAVDELRDKADKCRRGVMEKREEVLQRIKMLSHY